MLFKAFCHGLRGATQITLVVEEEGGEGGREERGGGREGEKGVRGRKRRGGGGERRGEQLRLYKIKLEAPWQ